jgi:hypothetical protein
MPSKAATFARVRALGLRLPGVEEGIAWGSPALKTAGQMIAVIPTHKSAEPGSLAVRIDFPQRDELLAADPDTYYLKDHYVNYPCVLVRLARIHDAGLRDLLRMGYDYVRSRSTRRTATRKRPANHLRQGYGGPPKPSAKEEAGHNVRTRARRSK